MQNNDKLCPFCGSEPVENKEHYIPNNLCCPHGHTTPMIRNEWNTRHAEKLVPSDLEEIKKLVLDLENAIEVLRVLRPFSVEWPKNKPTDRTNPRGLTKLMHESYNDGIRDCKAAFDAAVKEAFAVDKSYMGDGKTTSQEAKERKR